MEVKFFLLVLAALLFIGFKSIFALANGRSTAGLRTLIKISRWQRKTPGLSSGVLFKQMIAAVSRFVYMDENAGSKLGKDLKKAGLPITPQEYTAQKYLTASAGIGLTALCFIIHFYFGALISLLVTGFALMKQRDTIKVKIQQKELAISQEMPRFVRTLCRSLQSDRDLYNVVSAYRKVAGPEFGEELDIMLAEMRSGNAQSALAHFEDRLGLQEVSRLCGALRDMSLGIDQTATLSYIADDMARASKENMKRELSLKPGKMRRTYYPAIGVCIAMILYVLVVYVMNNFNSIL